MFYLTRLIEARKKAGLSQTQIANALQIPQQQYSRYEKGTNDLPIRYLVPICNLLSISSDWLLGLTETAEIRRDNLQKYEIRNTITGECATVYFAENINISSK